jgi:hypothetical protein
LSASRGLAVCSLLEWTWGTVGLGLQCYANGLGNLDVDLANENGARNLKVN